MQLLDKKDDQPTRQPQILNMRSYEAVVCRRRLIAAATALAWLALIPLGIALLTSYWIIIDFVNTDFEQVNIKLGPWGEWRTRTNGTLQSVDWIPHFPTPPADILRLADADLKHFHRAQAAIGIISVGLLIATNLLALYTFCHHRYIYKRLTAALYFITAVCIFATTECVSKSVDEWKVDVAQASKFGDWDFDAVKSYGYSSFLAFATAAICIFAALAFAYASHKQKGDNAATVDLEIEDRPMHVGRGF